MYKEVLRSISDVEIFPIISIVIFFLFFVGLVVWVLRMDKKFIRQIERLPLEDWPKQGEAHNGQADDQELKFLSHL